MSKQDIKNREIFDAEGEETPRATMPPIDVVAYNEMRSCHDLWTMYERGKLIIDPDFQRHNVWNTKDRSLFIDSLLKELPIPSVCLFHDNATGQKIVVDGLQRISSIIALLNPKGKDWTISDIEGVDERLRGKTVASLRADANGLLYTIEEKVLPVTVIRGIFDKKDHQEYLVQIFSRLNSGGRRLLNQEVRNCIFRGTLNNNLKLFVRTPSWLNFTGLTEKKVDDDRFGQEERALRLFAFWKNVTSYKSSLNRFLNDTMHSYRNMSNEDFQSFESVLSRALIVCARISEGGDTLKKNWNICEAVLVGIMSNIDTAEHAEDVALNQAYQALFAAVSAEGMREGLMQPGKVKFRMQKAVECFAL